MRRARGAERGKPANPDALPALQPRAPLGRDGFQGVRGSEGRDVGIIRDDVTLELRQARPNLAQIVMARRRLVVHSELESARSRAGLLLIPVRAERYDHFQDMLIILRAQERKREKAREREGERGRERERERDGRERRARETGESDGREKGVNAAHMAAGHRERASARRPAHLDPLIEPYLPTPVQRGLGHGGRAVRGQGRQWRRASERE